PHYYYLHSPIGFGLILTLVALFVMLGCYLVIQICNRRKVTKSEARSRLPVNKDNLGSGVDEHSCGQPVYDSVNYCDGRLYDGNLDQTANEYLEIKPTQFDPPYGYLLLKPGSDSVIDNLNQADKRA